MHAGKRPVQNVQVCDSRFFGITQCDIAAHRHQKQSAQRRLHLRYKPFRLLNRMKWRAIIDRSSGLLPVFTQYFCVATGACTRMVFSVATCFVHESILNEKKYAIKHMASRIFGAMQTIKLRECCILLWLKPVPSLPRICLQQSPKQIARGRGGDKLRRTLAQPTALFSRRSWAHYQPLCRESLPA